VVTTDLELETRVELLDKVGLLDMPVRAKGREMDLEGDDLTNGMDTLIGTASVRPLGLGQVTVFQAVAAGADGDGGVVDQGACLDESTLQLLFHRRRAVVVFL
jgi:hypothetical protein